MAPAVAARGLPVMAIQLRPCSTGFWVAGKVGGFCAKLTGKKVKKHQRTEIDFFMKES
jgi:hypothetical protein